MRTLILKESKALYVFQWENVNKDKYLTFKELEEAQQDHKSEGKHFQLQEQETTTEEKRQIETGDPSPEEAQTDLREGEEEVQSVSTRIRL